MRLLVAAFLAGWCLAVAGRAAYDRELEELDRAAEEAERIVRSHLHASR